MNHTKLQAQAFILYALDNQGSWPVVSDPEKKDAFFSSFENALLEQSLSPYLVPAGWVEKAPSYTKNGVGGAMWVCFDSPLFTKEDETGRTKYYNHLSAVHSGLANSYTGLSFHYREDSRVSGIAVRPQSWREGYFSQPSRVPVQWCSRRFIRLFEGDTSADSLKAQSFHPGYARPTGFVDGHSSLLTKPRYTEPDYLDLLVGSSNAHARWTPGENWGDFALSEE